MLKTISYYTYSLVYGQLTYYISINRENSCIFIFLNGITISIIPTIFNNNNNNNFLRMGHHLWEHILVVCTCIPTYRLPQRYSTSLYSFHFSNETHRLYNAQQKSFPLHICECVFVCFSSYILRLHKRKEILKPPQRTGKNLIPQSCRTSFSQPRCIAASNVVTRHSLRHIPTPVHIYVSIHIRDEYFIILFIVKNYSTRRFIPPPPSPDTFFFLIIV